MIDPEKFVQDIIKRRIGNKLEEIKQYYDELERKFQTDKKRLSKRKDMKKKSQMTTSIQI